MKLHVTQTYKTQRGNFSRLSFKNTDVADDLSYVMMCRKGLLQKELIPPFAD
jgi:hypothetical protein